MLLKKHENQVPPYISVWRCGFSSANRAHQKSKPVMLLSQVKLVMFARDTMRDRHIKVQFFLCIFL